MNFPWVEIQFFKKKFCGSYLAQDQASPNRGQPGWGDQPFPQPGQILGFMEDLFGWVIPYTTPNLVQNPAQGHCVPKA